MIDYLTEVGVDKDFTFCPRPVEELITDAEKLVEKLDEEDVKLLSSLCTLLVCVEHCDSISSQKMREELESEMDYIEGEWNRLRY